MSAPQVLGFRRLTHRWIRQDQSFQSHVKSAPYDNFESVQRLVSESQTKLWFSSKIWPDSKKRQLFFTKYFKLLAASSEFSRRHNNAPSCPFGRYNPGYRANCFSDRTLEQKILWKQQFGDHFSRRWPHALDHTVFSTFSISAPQKFLFRLNKSRRRSGWDFNRDQNWMEPRSNTRTWFICLTQCCFFSSCCCFCHSTISACARTFCQSFCGVCYHLHCCCFCYESYAECTDSKEFCLGMDSIDYDMDIFETEDAARERVDEKEKLTAVWINSKISHFDFGIRLSGEAVFEDYLFVTFDWKELKM